MPILYKKVITPEFCRAYPRWLFVFGDNLVRKGTGGQAVIRHEPNAVGIATKRYPTNLHNAFLSDDMLDQWKKAEADRFEFLAAHLRVRQIVVWPLDGIGTGLAKLSQKAPDIYRAILRNLEWLEKI